MRIISGRQNLSVEEFTCVSVCLPVCARVCACMRACVLSADSFYCIWLRKINPYHVCRFGIALNALHATDSNARPRKHTDTRERVRERDEKKEGELNASITMEIFRDVEKERRRQMRGKDSRSARHVCRELPPVELIMELCTHGRTEHRSGRGFAWVGVHG